METVLAADCTKLAACGVVVVRDSITGYVAWHVPVVESVALYTCDIDAILRQGHHGRSREWACR
jgi:hypothetical protein